MIAFVTALEEVEWITKDLGTNTVTTSRIAAKFNQTPTHLFPIVCSAISVMSMGDTSFVTFTRDRSQHRRDAPETLPTDDSFPDNNSNREKRMHYCEQCGGVPGGMV